MKTALTCLVSAWIILSSVQALSAPQAMTPDEIIALAQSGVDYSYYWGRGSWRMDGTQHGSCSGSCPDCTHSGTYGADCSGYVGKVWQVPSPSPVETNTHPYSTYNFRWESHHWNQVDRSSAKRADAMVYRNSSNSGGHIVLFESGDPWGQAWAYEAKGCSYGIVHNLRTFSSAYVTIRRDNLNEGPAVGTLTGSIFVDQGSGTDDMSQRIPGAQVSAAGLSTNARAEDAIWSLEVQVGDHQVSASASGYHAASRTCAVSAGQTTWCSIGLTEVCQPNCGGKTCGPDGCGGSCGSCGADHQCTAEGQCQCQPDCTGQTCGPDPVCGQSCGACADSETCTDGQCQCQPACGSLQCGPDPVCGSSCGSCLEDQECQAGQCVDPVCQPLCTDRQCGLDPLCGASCGQCGPDEFCDEAGLCQAAGCQPDCSNRACGPDPQCARSCGTCQTDRLCSPTGMCERIDPSSGKLYGTVTQAPLDENYPEQSSPLAGVDIRLDDGATLRVDENGYWELEVQPREYLVFASAPGYLTQSQSCTVEPGGHTECPLVLSPGEGDENELVIQGGCATSAGNSVALPLVLMAWAVLWRKRKRRS